MFVSIRDLLSVRVTGLISQRKDRAMKKHAHRVLSVATLALSVALAGSAFAQSGGPGTHQNAMRSGSAASTQKIQQQQHGYRGEPVYNYAAPSRPSTARPGCDPSLTGGGSAGFNKSENYCGY